MAFEQEMILLGKVALAGLFGAIIGLERELLKKPAGLRTHALVAAAAALLLGVSLILTDSFIDRFGGTDIPYVRADPLAAIEAIIVGISFIGAGVVIQQREEGTVRNLTTAASILVVAGVGIAVALGAYWLAAGVVLLVLLVNVGLGRLEERVLNSKPEEMEKK